MSTNLRDKETAALASMLTLASKDGTEDFGDRWKVLIYDRDSRDVIAPLMDTAALRARGVTLHLLIENDREPIPDGPAVYFVRPTEENISRIVSDCSRQLYKCFHVHFLTRIEKPLLEKFAQMLVSIGNPTIPTLVTRVVDEYLDIVSLESNMFSMNIPDSYIAYNDPKIEESQIKKFMSRMSMSLLSLVRIMNAVPIIRTANDSPAAKMLATAFCTLLQENLHPRGPASSLLQNSLIADKRPLLLIFDRSSDFVPILQHNLTYQALIDDLLEHRNNQVTIETKPDKDSSSSAKKNSKFGLNSQNDAFLAQYCRALFPKVIEANDEATAAVSRIEKEIKSRPEDPNQAINNLSEAINSLPELNKRKENLAMHTSILEAVMGKIKSRDVPSYFEAEQSLMSPVTLSSTLASKMADCFALLRDQKGLMEDKARLYLLSVIYCCSSGSSSGGSKDFEELDNAFSTGCEGIPAPNTPSKEAIDKVKAAAGYVRKSMQLKAPFSGSNAGGGGYGKSAVNNLTSTTNAVFSSIFAKAASYFTRVSPMAVTRIVDNLSEGRSCPENDSYIYLDPRQQIDSRAGASNRDQSSRINQYSEVIVFVIGGGCYAEFDNLQELVADKIKASAESGVTSGLKSVVYGTTELMNGDKFLKQLQHLGSR